MASNSNLSDPLGTREERLASRNWLVKEIFLLAEERGLNSPGWQPFADLILEKTGNRIPSGSLKYWANGHSTPKVSEVEDMAEAIGYELDLMKKETEE